MRFFDSHAHLAGDAFGRDVDDVLVRARESGLVGVLCVGESISAARRAREIAASHSDVIFSAGVHPHDAAAFQKERDIDAIRELIAEGAAAIGECGLDYHYDHAPRAAQRHAFESQIVLAAETGRALIVHSRDAEPDTAALLTAAAGEGVRGVLHCFTGSAELAEQALLARWMISFSGIITFRKWERDDVVRLVPDDLLLAESDAPYLAPVPHRGHRNEPAWVARTIERLASVRSTSADRIGRLSIDNALRLFALAPASRAS